MQRALAAVLLVPLIAVMASAAKTFEVFFIDVEGGQSTLVVTPDGQSILIDAGYGSRGAREGRDLGRVMAAMKDAGIDHLDFFLATHLHNDHVGGVPDLAAQVRIGTFIDYGDALGTDRMANNAVRAYKPVRDAHSVLVVKPGDRLPLTGITADVVSAGGDLLSAPLRGGGGLTPGCDRTEDHPEDGTENYRSVGVMFEFGAFRFLDLGDLSGNTLTRIVCPMDLLGPASVYLVSHHGDYDSNVPVLYRMLQPRVTIMNNGASKGGAVEAFRTLDRLPDLEGLWQLHATRNEGARNAPDDFVANFDNTTDGNILHLSAREDGSFRLTNARNGFAVEYGPRRGKPARDVKDGS